MFSKSFYRDGMRRTRKFRIVWYVLMVFVWVYGIGKFQIVNSNTEGLWFQESMTESMASHINSIISFTGIITMLGIPLLMLLVEWTLHGYHRNRRIADTMITLPVRAKERYWTSAVISLDNLARCLLVRLFVEVSLVGGLWSIFMKEGSEMLKKNRIATIKGFCLDSLSAVAAAFVLGFVLLAILGLCRELSHSGKVFFTWLIIIIGGTVSARPLFSLCVRIHSNLFVGATTWDALGGRYALWRQFIAIPDPDVLLLWCVIGIVLLLLGYRMSCGYTVSYLENERANRKMFRALLIVLDSIAILLAGTIIYAVEDVSISLRILGILLPLLIHVLVCRIYQEKKFLKSLRYLAVSVAIACAMIGGVILCSAMLTRLPKEDSIRLIGWYQESTFASPNGYDYDDIGELIVSREGIHSIYQRIEDVKNGSSFEKPMGDYTPTHYYTMVLFTSHGTKSYQIPLTEGQWFTIANDSRNQTAFLAHSAVGKESTSTVLTEEELREYKRLLSEEKHAEQIIYKRQLFGGMKEVGREILPFRDTKIKWTSWIPIIFTERGMVFYEFAGEANRKSSEYALSIAEKRCGDRVRRLISEHLESGASLPTSGSVKLLSAEYLSTDDKRGVYFAIDKARISATVYIMNEEKEVEGKYEARQEKIKELFELLNQYTDGDGGLNDAAEFVFLLRDHRLGEYADCGIENEWYVTIPQAVVNQWVDSVVEENHEEFVQ